MTWEVGQREAHSRMWVRSMSAVEFHADALEWVQAESEAWDGIAGLTPTQRAEVAALVFAKSALTRHAPEPSDCLCDAWCRLNCSDPPQEDCGWTAWPCPDAQAALDFIKAIR